MSSENRIVNQNATSPFREYLPSSLERVGGSRRVSQRRSSYCIISGGGFQVYVVIQRKYQVFSLPSMGRQIFQPGAPHFWGVDIWFTRTIATDNISLEKSRTQNTSCVVEGLPLFSALTVHVKALYKMGEDYIRSETVDEEFIIGGGGG